jgi:uracil-DNA glycosylase
MKEQLEILQKEVLGCTRCGLCKTRNKVIFGEGDWHSKIFVIGEAPGYEEDMQGGPFVGKSGQLLDKIFEACGFTRTGHVFISNIIKCRPPENRVPSQREAETCMPYLLKQIELIQPKILILLGSTALKHMFGSLGHLWSILSIFLL